MAFNHPLIRALWLYSACLYLLSISGFIGKCSFLLPVSLPFFAYSSARRRGLHFPSIYPLICVGGPLSRSIFINLKQFFFSLQNKNALRRQAEADKGAQTKKKKAEWGEAECYHAGLSTAQRRRVQTAFMKVSGISGKSFSPTLSTQMKLQAPTAGIFSGW